jgi:hypothetical protein
MARDPAPTHWMPRGHAEQLEAGVWETDRVRAFGGVWAGRRRRRRVGGGSGAGAGPSPVCGRHREGGGGCRAVRGTGPLVLGSPPMPWAATLAPSRKAGATSAPARTTACRPKRALSLELGEVRLRARKEERTRVAASPPRCPSCMGSGSPAPVGSPLPARPSGAGDSATARRRSRSVAAPAMLFHASSSLGGGGARHAGEAPGGGLPTTWRHAHSLAIG